MSSTAVLLFWNWKSNIKKTFLFIFLTLCMYYTTKILFYLPMSLFYYVVKYTFISAVPVTSFTGPWENQKYTLPTRKNKEIRRLLGSPYNRTSFLFRIKNNDVYCHLFQSVPSLLLELDSALLNSVVLKGTY